MRIERAGKPYKVIAVAASIVAIGVVFFWAVDTYRMVKETPNPFALKGSPSYVAYPPPSEPPPKPRSCAEGAALTIADIPEGWSVTYLDPLCLAMAHPKGWAFSQPSPDVSPNSWGIEDISKGVVRAEIDEETGDKASELLDKTTGDGATAVDQGRSGVSIYDLGILSTSSSQDFIIDDTGSKRIFKLSVVYGAGNYEEASATVRQAVASLTGYTRDADDFNMERPVGIAPKDWAPLTCGEGKILTIADVPKGWSVSYLESICMAFAHPSDWILSRIQSPRGWAIYLGTSRNHLLGSISGWYSAGSASDVLSTDWCRGYVAPGTLSELGELSNHDGWKICDVKYRVHYENSNDVRQTLKLFNDDVGYQVSFSIYHGQTINDGLARALDAVSDHVVVRQ